MAYSFTDFLRDVDAELLTLIDKTHTDFHDYEFESDFNSQLTVALSVVEAIIQHGSISEVATVNPDNILIYHSLDSDPTANRF